MGGGTVKFLETFRDIKIYCFEPDPRCISIFKSRIKDSRCILKEAAVSNMDGEAFLNISEKLPQRFFRVPGMTRIYMLLNHSLFKNFKESLGQSSIKRAISRPKQYQWLVFDKKVKVNTVKLDTWARGNKISSIDFIWSDVQGAEKEMIEGATDTLKIVKYLYTEYGEVSTYPEAMTRNKTIELLSQQKFEIVPEYSGQGATGNLLFKNKRS